MTIQFETDPSLIAGLELKTRSRKIAWTAEHSLHKLQEEVMERLECHSPWRPPVTADLPVLETLVRNSETTLSTVLADFQADLKAEGIGVVHFVGNGIARVDGLPGIKSEELVRFPEQSIGNGF